MILEPPLWATGSWVDDSWADDTWGESVVAPDEVAPIELQGSYAPSINLRGQVGDD